MVRKHFIIGTVAMVGTATLFGIAGLIVGVRQGTLLALQEFLTLEPPMAARFIGDVALKSLQTEQRRKPFTVIACQMAGATFLFPREQILDESPMGDMARTNLMHKMRNGTCAYGYDQNL